MREIYQIFFSQSPNMTRIKAIIDEVAKTDVAILIKGETGSGKGLVAEAIHLRSERREKPFIKVNCSTIPRGLLESELFGFEKGAFTGAHLKKPGKFELANQGTILLSEIGEIDISIQAKLLQVLQDGTFSRLGGEGDVSADARVITSTKDHLEKRVMKGSFREDLFFRINVMTINIPPLRDRREQIIPLSNYFFNLYKRKYKRTIPDLSPKITQRLKDYHWPGNIQEVENLMKRVVVFGDEEVVFKDTNEAGRNTGIALEPNRESSSSAAGEADTYDLKGIGKKAAEQAEKAVIQSTLQKTQWNRKEAAQLLRVSYKALLYKIQKYQLNNRRRLQTEEACE